MNNKPETSQLNIIDVKNNILKRIERYERDIEYANNEIENKTGDRNRKLQFRLHNIDAESRISELRLVLKYCF